MDAFLQLMVTEMNAMDGLDIDQKVYNWECVDYPQEPAIYRWGKYVELVPNQIPDYLYDMLPEEYKEKAWPGFDGEGEGLYMLG